LIDWSCYSPESFPHHKTRPIKDLRPSLWQTVQSTVIVTEWRPTRQAIAVIDAALARVA